MAKRKTQPTKAVRTVAKAPAATNEPEHRPDPHSLSIAKRGIKTGSDFANFMSAMMTDLIEQRISPGIGNAACNAGGKLLKVVEMQYKYGTSSTTGSKVLTLAAPQPTDDPAAR
jgi:hypothetical protein